MHTISVIVPMHSVDFLLILDRTEIAANFSGHQYIVAPSATVMPQSSIV